MEQVRIKIDEDSNPYVEVRLLISGDIAIVENGSWYFA